MQIRGFALSDHADWPGLLTAIEATGAQQIFVTHGYVSPLIRWLEESGLDARSFETHFGEEDDVEGSGETSADENKMEQEGIA